jgi:hypothetical protein
MPRTTSSFACRGPSDPRNARARPRINCID